MAGRARLGRGRPCSTSAAAPASTCPRLAERAERGLRRRAARAAAGPGPAPDRGPGQRQVLPGTAQRVPLPDACIDVAMARWAYFFGPGCEPGLRELGRLVRRGGAAFVVDVDPTRSSYGAWFREWLPSYDAVAVQRFWAMQGWSRTPARPGWSFEQPGRPGGRRPDRAAT